MPLVRKSYINPQDLPDIESATLARIVRLIRPYSGRGALILACVIVAALLNLSVPWLVKQVIDVAIPGKDLTVLWLCGAGMIAAPLAAGLLQVAQKYNAEALGQQVMFDLRVGLYRHLQAMPIEYFTKQRPGEAVSHVLNDVQGAGGVVNSTLIDLAQSTIVLASTLAFVFALDWRLAAISVVFLPFFAASTRRVGRRRKALKRNVQARTSELTGLLGETLSVSGALLTKVFGREEAEVARLRRTLNEIRRLSLEQSLVGRWFQMLLGLLESIGPALVFAVGGTLVVRGHVPLGTIVAFVSVLKRLYNPASQLAGAHVDLKISYAYFDRIFAVMDRTPAVTNPAHPVERSRVNGRIEFRQASLAYTGGAPAVSEVDLTIPAGTTCALVGPSGAGKSSLASLLMRLYDTTDGSVLVDGIDVRAFDLAALRGQIGIVTQDTFLLNDTVLENLRYAKPSATRAEIEAAAEQADIHHVIAGLPDGYETIVGERGYRFSAGERQRLAIARAILKDPRILILDEATSSLDAASEHRIQDALKSLRRGRTCLVIAHRLSTVRDADSIVVLNDGRLVEQGTHSQLMAGGGLYAWLWRVQSREAVRALPGHGHDAPARRSYSTSSASSRPIGDDGSTTLTAWPARRERTARASS